MIRAKFITVADLSILDRIVKINIYLLLARIYQGELPNLPGIYFTVFLRDFFMKYHQKIRKPARKGNSHGEVQFFRSKFSL